MLGLASFLFSLVMYAIETYIVEAAIDRAMAYDQASYLVAVMNGAGLFGRILCNYAADSIGRLNSTLVAVFCTSASILALWLPAQSSGTMIAFAVVSGLGGNVTLSMFPVLVASTASLDELGSRIGVNMFASGLAALLGPPATGAVISRGGFQMAAGCLGGCCFVSGLFITILRIRLGIKQGWNK
ncbi:hypothetical protein JX266_014033 [Neoarthrinium moseri]|nr:hypothetical protein JX266_014033 [Neoarthrinium moseri]